MKAFGQVLAAESLMAENEAARQKSQQDIIKDQIQSQAAIMQSGLQNIAGGVNTAIATDSAARQAQLYRDANGKEIVDVVNPITGKPERMQTPLQAVMPEAAQTLLANFKQPTYIPQPTVTPDKANQFQTPWGTKW